MLITNHAALLVYMSEHPEATARTTSQELGITERTVLKLRVDLTHAGLVSIRRDGRNAVPYGINPRLVSAIKHVEELAPNAA